MTRLLLPYPPSTNRMWRHYRGRPVMSAEAREWKRNAAWLACEAGWRPMTGRLAVDITLHPRMTKKGKESQCRLDIDNAIKAVLDALNGVAYADDRQVIQLAARVGSAIPDGGLSVDVKQPQEDAKCAESTRQF